jgi:transposase InsO family protein
VVEQREQFVRLARQPDANVSALCRQFAISRKTGYKWLGRASCEDLPRRPHTSPNRTAAQIEARVLVVRDAHPAWGARKIAHVLRQREGIELAVSTVNTVLRRYGCISEQASCAATKWQRFEHDAPNALWQMDFKGHFATHAQRCHPLTVLDDHSRFNVVLQALGNERGESVQPVLHRAFEEYGLPERINADNGPPWGVRGREAAVTQLGVWLMRLGVRLSHSRPLHPQTNGKDERFHRTLKAEVLSGHEFKNLDDAQAQFTRWRQVYNHERPHEALRMAAPISRWRPSSRRMPAKLPAIEYRQADLVRRVQDGGFISLGGWRWRVGKALTGQPVACRPLAEDGHYAVFFCDQKLIEIDLTQP